MKAEMEMGEYKMLWPFCHSDKNVTRMLLGAGGGCPAMSSGTSHWGS